MPVRILIPTPLRPYTDQQPAVLVEGPTVGDVLRNLTERHADLRPHLFREDGRLRSFVNLYVNDESIRDLEGENTAVSERDTISIVPSVAGGADAAVPETLPDLTQDEVARYSRHLIMPEVGIEGQRRLKAARILCVGAGGLGSPASLYLAAAGVGTLGLVDFDVVDASNLQRQILYGTPDVGRPKLVAARERLSQLNPTIRIVAHEGPLTSANALDIIRDYDVVIDGADNFPARYLVNDACVLLGKPNVYGSIFRFEGQASVFAAADGPCYRCLYPEPPPPGLVPSCAEGGVLGILPGIVGTIQAAEAIKLVTGTGRPLVGRLLLLDALDMSFRTMKLRRDPACAVCSPRRTITRLIDYEHFCGVAPGTQAQPPLPPELVTTVEALADRIRRHDPVWILDVREPREFEICRIPGSVLIPLGDLPKRLDEVPRGEAAPDIVVHCRSGVRSAKAVRLLREHGFERVRNLEGGILVWIDRIDPTQSKY
ncbi:MAG TPA: molybdopterin-synthase adenylyltransferase MoeB [Vicinamibacterales bacterium]|nr:molybdopterin-synthase adenylyltransferase MoeB [Vicinamibacterales bacterium]